jgi:hypothetical protein
MQGLLQSNSTLGKKEWPLKKTVLKISEAFKRFGFWSPLERKGDSALSL